MINHELVSTVETPYQAQIAVDGIWEESVGCDLTLDSVESVTRQMATRDGKLALEIAYRMNNGRRINFGLKQDEKLKQANTREAFLAKLPGLLSAVAELKFVDGVALIGEELNDNNKTFLQSPLHQIEMGVNNNWNSAGPCEIWATGDNVPNEFSILARLRGHDTLKSNKLSFISLKHLFDEPINHWLSIEVSDTADNNSGICSLNLPFAVEVSQLTF